MKKIIQAASGLATTWFVFASFTMAQDNTLTIKQPDRGISSISELISQGINFAIIIAAILTFAYLIWGGIQWITSGGDKAAYEEARGRITAAVLGLGIVAAAYAVMWIIGNFFGINILQDGITWPSAGKK